MCVIIIKEPNVILPYNKIAAACETNSNGFGVSVLKGQELLTFKNFDPLGNDPDALYKIIMEHNEHPQYIHLRFSTRGTKNLDNTHPFVVLDKPDCKVEFMHNGTLQKWGDNEKSDTRDFAEKVVAPLCESFYELHGREFLKHEALAPLLDGCSGNGYFVIYDSLGNYIQVGGTGYKHDGWWSSNVYSFQSGYRTPSKASSQNSYSSYAQNTGSSKAKDYDDFDDYVQSLMDNNQEHARWKNHRGDIVEWDLTTQDYKIVCSAQDLARAREEFKKAKAAAQPTDASASNVHPLPVPVISNKTETAMTAANDSKEEKKEQVVTVPFRDYGKEKAEDTAQEAKVLGYALSEAKRKRLSWAEHVAPAKRKTFVELAGIEKLDEVCVFTIDEVENIVLQTPQAATLLIIDLLSELYTSKVSKKESAA